MPVRAILRCGAASACFTMATIACGSTAPAERVDEPYLTGVVESMVHRATASSMVVRPFPGSGDSCGIAATVDAETRYFQRLAEGADSAMALADLEIGDTVAVYVTGPIAESCPVQGYAVRIVRLVGDGSDR